MWASCVGCMPLKRRSMGRDPSAGWSFRRGPAGPRLSPVNGAILGQGLVGSMVGPCWLAAYVGSGGMGTVYQGRVERKTPGLRLGERVAVKIFNAPEELPGTHLERFLRE